MQRLRQFCFNISENGACKAGFICGANMLNCANALVEKDSFSVFSHHIES